MSTPLRNKPEKIAKIATMAALEFLVCMGLAVVVFQIKPFWVDEWRIIYNLKIKDAAALWGPLDFMQQFPRVYMQFIKAFTQYFDYSYFSLRFPSFVLGTLALYCCYRLMKRLFPGDYAGKFLFVLILASSHTFVVYYVQIKQYTMDILLSIVALWQLMQLLQLKEKGRTPVWRYCLLCLTFIAAPFLSYSYPILAVPVVAVAALQSIFFIPGNETHNSRSVFIVKLWLPLLLCMISLVAFYIIDVAQLMKDHGMQQFWESMMMRDGFHPVHFLYSFYLVFANLGSGLLFEIIFGITGIVAFILAIAHQVMGFRAAINDNGAQVRLYSILLILLILALFVAGKLPIGEPRLNSYSVPAISILIIYLLQQSGRSLRFVKATSVLTVVLFLGTIGNIANSMIKNVAGKDNYKKLAIYNNVTAAIKLAQAKHLPIVVASAIAFPDEKVICFPLTDVRADVLCYPPDYNSTLHFMNGDVYMPADWVLKTMPAYKMSDSIPVYGIDFISNTPLHIDSIPGNAHSVVAVDDTSYRIYNK